MVAKRSRMKQAEMAAHSSGRSGGDRRVLQSPVIGVLQTMATATDCIGPHFPRLEQPTQLVGSWDHNPGLTQIRPAVASSAVTFGSNDGSRRSRRDRAIHRRIHEWIRATREDVSWGAWQATQDLRPHGGVNSTTIINVALWQLASKRQDQHEAVSALVQSEEFVTIEHVIPIARR